MATLIILCGLPGAGKTTLAKRLEQERSALRLTPDEWIAQIIKDVSDREELDRLRGPMEAVQWEVAKRALSLGVNVVQDWGLWSRQERDYYRAEAKALGARVELHFLEVGKEALWERISRRNADLPPGTFYNSREELDHWWEVFEPPTEEELALFDPA